MPAHTAGDSTLTSKKCCEADKEAGNTWDGEYVVAYRYKMRIMTIYMGMGHSSGAAVFLFALLVLALLRGGRSARPDHHQHLVLCE